MAAGCGARFPHRLVSRPVAWGGRSIVVERGHVHLLCMLREEGIVQMRDNRIGKIIHIIGIVIVAIFAVLGLVVWAGSGRLLGFGGFIGCLIFWAGGIIVAFPYFAVAEVFFLLQEISSKSSDIIRLLNKTSEYNSSGNGSFDKEYERTAHDRGDSIILCPVCQAKQSMDRKVCYRCGARLDQSRYDFRQSTSESSDGEAVCRFCGKENERYARFCEKCGKPLS